MKINLVLHKADGTLVDLVSATDEGLERGAGISAMSSCDGGGAVD